ncbi:hypothetical protein Tco_0492165 [Tanacetum coccineum]
MSEGDQHIDIGALRKFDMPLHTSDMTAKDVKSLALRHGIPLDLHPVALTKERAIPDAMAWRHHDSDVNDPSPEDGFSASDVQMLTEQVVDLRTVPSRLLFLGGLATAWDFPGFCLVFKDTEGNVVTMSEYLIFPFLSGAFISKVHALTSQDQIEQHTARPLSSDRAISEKIDHQKGVEVEDPKIVAIRERKARVAAKKREKKRQGGDGGQGSRPATKRKKTAGRKDGSAASKATSSPKLIQTINPTGLTGVVAETAESREDRSLRVSPRGSADYSVHNYSDIHHDNEEGEILRLGTFRDQSRRAMTHVDTKVVQPSSSPQTTYHSPVATQPAFPLRPLQRGNPEAGESSRGLMVHLAPPAAQEELNALNNFMALDQAWFSLARGSLAQNDILERFENLQADFGKLAESHAKCGDLAGKLVQARLDIKLSYDLYNSQSDRFKAFRSGHEGCAGKLEALEDQMEKFDCIRKLLPPMVERLLRSHEYKQSLSEPFNLAIQAGWDKGLAEERSEEDLLALMGRMEGFDAYVDKKMKVEYDKLFEKRYHYMEKISRDFCHSVSDLLMVYPDSPPHGQAPPSKPSFRKAHSTSALRGS